MLTRDQAASIFSRLRQHCTADEIELLISGGRSALTRFANNTIHQNVAEENYLISVRTSFDVGSSAGARTARATTNKHDDESLRRVVRSAEGLARVQHADPDLLPMPTGEEVLLASADTPEPVRRYFDATSRVSPQDRGEGVARIVDVAKRHKLTAAGVYSSSEVVEGIFNSRGVEHWHEQTSAEVSVTMLDTDSSGWQKANSPDVEQIRPERLAEVAAEKAIASRKPRELSPGKYTVILEPAAVLDLVGFMFWDFGGTAVLEQRSFLTGRVGTQLFGQNVSIADDTYHTLQSGAPFDGEGMRRQRAPLVENGVVRQLTYARGSARRMQESDIADKVGAVKATGHGFALPNEIGEAPLNVVFGGPAAGEAQTVEQMIEGTERAILVTRVWYIREVDPYEKIVTGMTRDGTFLVENGKVVCGIRNFRLNESLIRMLNHVEAMSQPVRASGEEAFDMVVPAMKVQAFNFTEVTKF